MSRPQKLHRTNDNKFINTRQALIQAALELINHKSFDGISLREVAREAGISPAAFYRHFENMESLGIEIVHETFGELRTSLKEARSQEKASRFMGLRSIQCLFKLYQNHPEGYRFVVSEFDGGVTPIRMAIADHWQLLQKDLYDDLCEFSDFDHLSSETLSDVSNLIATTIIRVAADVLMRSKTKEQEQMLISRTVKQLRLIHIGAMNWRDGID